MKKLRPKEVALIIFLGTCILGAQLLSLLEAFFIYCEGLAILILILWSLYYIVLIIMAVKESKPRSAILLTIGYVVLLIFSLPTLW